MRVGKAGEAGTAEGADLVGEDPSSSRSDRLAALALVALVILVYANSLSGGFVFDSAVLVLEDPRIKALSLENLQNIVRHTYWWPYTDTALYRPATTFSFLLNYSVFGNADQPAGYHAVNIGLHAINSCLLFALLRRLLGSLWPAVLGAALWAAHPLGTEAVANIVGRADLLAATGILAALVAHLRARESSGSARVLWIGGVALASLLACFAKESGVTVVGVIVLFDVLLPHMPTRPNAEEGPYLFASWAAAAVPAVLLVWARDSVIGAAAITNFPFVDNPIHGAGFWQGRLTALAVAGRYLWLAVWPATLSADYSYPQIPLSTGTIQDWVGWTMVAAVALVTALLYRTHRASFYLMLAAALTFLPVSNLLFATGTIMGERLAYLPLAFIVGVIAAGIFALQRVTAVRNLAPALLGLMVLALGARSIARNPDWHDELSLWNATAAAAPRSFKSHGALAEALYDADPSHANFDRVVAEKEISLSFLADIPHPEETSTPYRDAAAYYLERGDLLRDKNDTDAATKSYQRALELITRYLQILDIAPPPNAERANAQLMLASVHERLENGDAAVDAARSALAREPLSAIGYRTLAASLLSAKRNQEAAATLMTGFMLTGQAELRAALIDIYNAGLDTQHCAVTSGAAGQVLNVDCEVVRRHLCAASAAAAAVHRGLGREDLARQAEQAAGARCGT